MKIIKKIINFLKWIFLILFALFLMEEAFYCFICRRMRERQFTITQAPKNRVAVVFGAMVLPRRVPSDVLYDRVFTAVELYRKGKVQKLLMSGDNRLKNYNEPLTMKETAIELQVKEEDIRLDYAGLRTFDTCYRAKEIFGLRKATLVTQEFHLSRALFICSSLGLDVVGVAADQRGYKRENYYAFRERAAILNALWDLYVIHKKPKYLGQKEPSL